MAPALHEIRRCLSERRGQHLLGQSGQNCAQASQANQRHLSGMEVCKRLSVR